MVGTLWDGGAQSKGDEAFWIGQFNTNTRTVIHSAAVRWIASEGELSLLNKQPRVIIVIVY